MDNDLIRKRKLIAARVRRHRARVKAFKLRNAQAINPQTSSSEEDIVSLASYSSSDRDDRPFEEENESPEAIASSASSMAMEDELNLVSRENDAPEPNQPIVSSPPRREEQNERSSESSVLENSSSESEVERSDDSNSSNSENDEAMNENDDALNENPEAVNENPEAVNENPDLVYADKIRAWAIKNKIYQSALEELLVILKEELLRDLPKNAKTFLRTSSAKYTIEPMEGKNHTPGEFVYYGLKKGLEACIDPNVYTFNVLELKFFIDGLPVNQSGGDDELWPLLCQVHFIPDIYKPFPVAIFCGKEKPANTEVYFQKFINELNELLEDGILISGKQYAINIKCFICDTPARAFCKNTVGHVSISACERCTVKGTKQGVPSTVYHSVNSQERTDESFRNQADRAHHNGPTHLLNINPPINMISSFVLDFMHLCCLGVMKRLMEYWLFGDLNVRLGRRMRDALSDRMTLLKSEVPSDFQRKPKSSKKLAKWKATELRFFLLYCGPIVLKNVLPQRLYKHFLLLHVACRILCSNDFCITFNAYAKEYLTAFFKGLKSFYGAKSQVLNCHHIIHLADDVINMGCNLSRITAFSFESFLGKLKKKLRTPHRLLAQICRRLHEEESIMTEKPRKPADLEILKGKEENIFKIKFKQTVISTKNPDNTVLLMNNEVLKVTKIVGTLDNLQIQGYVYRKRRPIYSYPFDSSLLNMWEINKNPKREVKTFPVTSIKSKVVKLSATIRAEGSKHFYAVPLLHHD